MFRSSSPPLWFSLACTAAAAALAHALGLHALEAPPVAQAILGFVLAVASWIWTGVQVAATATLPYLQWAVTALWTFARSVYNGLVALGRVSVGGIRQAWGFLRDTYEHVLRPAWLKIWRLVDTVRAELERIISPILRTLLEIRREFLKLYDRFVRPVLDVLGALRRTARILAAVGLKWATALDRRIAELEDAIDRPFRAVLRKINEVVNVVNRIVTADGLFQRLALVRSVERDMAIISRSFWRLTSRPPTADEAASARAVPPTKSDAEHVDELVRALRERTGPIAARGDEAIADVIQRIRAARAP